MIFEVCVNPRSSRNRVERQGNKLKVYLTKPACEGMANKQLVDLLSEYLEIKKYQIRIRSGKKSRQKLVEIDAD
ncbi:MAG: DUF167 domain-containing protein [Candidatus Omnitrophica bacterium]|jgi:hypothetical protein|nr:DUF167 domain-containing protein [Candidatus Omnitrophota bacterium]MDD5690301.1 DUF167 domain-containing protein [Candidatus Omnitrophota bacterium]